jgi:N-acetylneuraminic acid mutarotase
VMVVGGLSGQREPLASSEFWDEGTGVWVFGPEMNRPHDLMATAVLPDGRFMMIGGTSKDENGLLISLTAETEAYDPATETWTELAPMAERRANHTATTLLDGRVLVVGGGKTDGPYLKVAEIYDPATGAWALAAPLTKGRAFHTATLLNDGRVLVIGGKGKIKIAEVYDPATDAWTSVGETVDPRSEHAAALLADGAVLITGGTGYLVTSELFDPTTNSWVTGEVLGTGRYRHSAFALNDGRVIIMGGTSKDGMLATTEIYGAK